MQVSIKDFSGANTIVSGISSNLYSSLDWTGYFISPGVALTANTWYQLLIQTSDTLGQEAKLYDPIQLRTLSDTSDYIVYDYNSVFAVVSLAPTIPTTLNVTTFMPIPKYTVSLGALYYIMFDIVPRVYLNKIFDHQSYKIQYYDYSH